MCQSCGTSAAIVFSVGLVTLSVALVAFMAHRLRAYAPHLEPHLDPTKTSEITNESKFAYAQVAYLVKVQYL